MAGGDWIGFLTPDQFLDHLTVIKTKYRINIVSISYRMKKKPYRSRVGGSIAFAPPRGNLSHVTCIIGYFVYGLTHVTSYYCHIATDPQLVSTSQS